MENSYLLKKNLDKTCKSAVAYVNPCEISKAVGNKRSNVKNIYDTMGIKLTVKGSEELRKREVRCVCY